MSPGVGINEQSPRISTQRAEYDCSVQPDAAPCVPEMRRVFRRCTGEPRREDRVKFPPNGFRMSPTPHDTPETEPERWHGRRLVVAVADETLRQWVLSEFTDAWFGPIEVISQPQGILTAFGMQEQSPVLLICGRGLSLLEERNGRSWESLSRELTVVLVESQGNMDLVRKHFPHVDAVLLQEVHLGMAVSIVQSAKSGVRGFPLELVEQLLAAPPVGLRPRGGNGAAPPFAAPPAAPPVSPSTSPSTSLPASLPASPPAPPPQQAGRTERVEAEAQPAEPEIREDPERPETRKEDGDPAGPSARRPSRPLNAVRLFLRRAWDRIAGRRN